MFTVLYALPVGGMSPEETWHLCDLWDGILKAPNYHPAWALWLGMELLEATVHRFPDRPDWTARTPLPLK